MTFDEIVAAVQSQGGFDVAVSMVGGWVNEVHRKVVARAKWLEEARSFGVTVAGTAVYDIGTDVADLKLVYLDDGSGSGPQDYHPVSPRQMLDLKSARSNLFGSGGVWVRSYGPLGEKRFELWPVPTASGVALTGLVAAIPALMASGASPVIPDDMHGGLVDGAIAIGLLRIDERPASAQAFDQRLEAMVKDLNKRRLSLAGSESARLQVWRTDWR